MRGAARYRQTGRNAGPISRADDAPCGAVASPMPRGVTLLRLGILDARAQLDRGDVERSLATATATAAQARDHGARRYELLARLVEVEATTRLGAATDLVGFRQLCRELPDAVAAALPAAFSQSLRRYARTRLDRTRMTRRRG